MNTTTERPLDQLARGVAAQVSRWGAAALEHGGGVQRSEALGVLSLLRRLRLEDLGSHPQLWQAVETVVPEPLRGRGDEASTAETAAFLAMSMYALAQQSRTDNAHANRSSGGVPLAVALGVLARSSTHSEAAMTRRFGALLTAQSRGEATRHLRSLVSLLRTARSDDGESRRLAARVDFGELARDLHLLLRPETAPGVRLRWSREFTSVSVSSTPSGPTEPAPNA